MINILPTVLMVIGGALIYVGVTNPFNLDAVLCLVIITLGLAEIFMAIYEKKLTKLEEKLSRFIYDFDSDDLPMEICNKCGRKYDMDVKECPYCELERLKKYSDRRG